MIEIVWGILNIAILIYFIIICFKSTKIIREKLGIFAALIFVFGLLSFIAKPNDGNIKDKTIDLLNQNTNQYKFEGNTYSSEIKLEDNIATEINLRIMFSENEKGKKLISAQTNRSGFVSGTNWRTTNVSLEKSKSENNFHYNVTGILEWKILGLKLYSESKDFKGSLELVK